MRLLLAIPLLAVAPAAFAGVFAEISVATHRGPNLYTTFARTANSSIEYQGGGNPVDGGNLTIIPQAPGTGSTRVSGAQQGFCNGGATLTSQAEAFASYDGPQLTVRTNTNPQNCFGSPLAFGLASFADNVTFVNSTAQAQQFVLSWTMSGTFPAAGASTVTSSVQIVPNNTSGITLVGAQFNGPLQRNSATMTIPATGPVTFTKGPFGDALPLGNNPDWQATDNSNNALRGGRVTATIRVPPGTHTLEISADLRVTCNTGVVCNFGNNGIRQLEFLNVPAGLSWTSQSGRLLTTPSAEVGPPVTGSGASQTLTMRFSHPQGFQKLGVVNALINNFLNGDFACYIAYSQPLQTLYLVNDQGPGSGISAGLTLGSSNSVANSQCTIFGAGSSASGSGDTLTLTLNVQFKAGFTGNKVIYLAARDQTTGNSGWRTMGTSYIPETSVAYPRADVMTPASGTAGSQTFVLTYQDATNATNLQTAWFLANTAIDGRAACYIAYSRPANTVYLVPDNGDGAQAVSMPLSGSGTLENSQCRLSASGSSAAVSGNQLTLTLNVAFKGNVIGSRGVWAATQTLSNQVSPWKMVGAWVVPPTL